MNAGTDFLDRLDIFYELLSRNGFIVPVAAQLDAAASLEEVTLDDPHAVRVVLRANLCHSVEEQRLFDVLFRTYWLGWETEVQPFSTMSAAADNDADDSETIGADASRAHREKEGDLDEDWASFDRDLLAAVRRLKRLLHKTRGRRWRPARNGIRFNFRRTLTSYLRSGLEFTSLDWMDRKPNKVRLVCMVDVSNSMSTHVQYLVRFTLAVHRIISGARTIFFSSDARDMTGFISRHSDEAVINELRERFPWWQSGTDIGGALAYVNNHFPGGLFHEATVVIISDGFDRGDKAQLQREMKRLSHSCKRLIWINPLLHSKGYEPTARGMADALPFVDDFLAAFDAKTLLTAVKRIAVA